MSTSLMVIVRFGCLLFKMTAMVSFILHSNKTVMAEIFIVQLILSLVDDTVLLLFAPYMLKIVFTKHKNAHTLHSVSV